MGKLGVAIREYDHSAFEHYEYLGLDEPGWYIRHKGDGWHMEFWYYSGGQEGDVCLKCKRDISDHDDMLINHDEARTRCMCLKCADQNLHSSIVR